MTFNYNATRFVAFFSYDLTLSSDTINAGSDISATAATNDTSVTQVAFFWKDPSNSTAASNVKPVTVGSVRTAIDILLPNQSGVWTLDAHFKNATGGNVAVLTKNFAVISPANSYIYSLALDRETVQISNPILATAGANDTSITEVVFVWIDPGNNTKASHALPFSLDGSNSTGTAQDSFTPDAIGQWKVDAHFNNLTHADVAIRSKLFNATEEPGGTDNHQPVAVDDVATTLEDVPVLINVVANDSDPDGDQFFVSSFIQAGNGSVTDNHNGTLTYAPLENYNGQDSFAYRISDGSLESENLANVTISITPVNDAPTANAGADQNVDEESLVLLNGSATDIDEDGNLLFSWSQVSGPVSVTLAGADTLTPSFTAPSILHNGVAYNLTLTFELVVTDDEGATSSDTVVVTVNDVNKPPVADAGPDQTVKEKVFCSEFKEGYEESGHHDDDDGNDDDCEEEDERGEHDYYETITDAGSAGRDHDDDKEDDDCEDDGRSEQDDFEAAIDAMTGGRHDDDDEDEECPKPTLVRLSGSGSDADGDALEFSWEQIEGPAVVLSNASSAAPSFTAPEVDEDTLLTFELTVSDGFGGNSSDTVDILVLDINGDGGSLGGKVKVAGGGSLGKDAYFGFIVKSSDHGETLTGWLGYLDKDSDIKLLSKSITSLTVSEDGNEATFEGTGRLNGDGEYAFIVTVEDNGKSGKDDKFAITIPELDYAKGGTLAIGNIKIYD